MGQYRAVPEAMPGNPAANRVGDKTGLFRVRIEYRDQNGPWQTLEYRDEVVPYDEAFAAAGKYERALNSQQSSEEPVDNDGDK